MLRVRPPMLARRRDPGREATAVSRPARRARAGGRPQALPVLLLGLALAVGVHADPVGPPWRPDALLVRFHATGPHALRECAEALSRGAGRFAGATADGSDSLDRLTQELGVRSLRALFRRSDGCALPVQRRALARRLGVRAGRGPDLSHVYRVELASGTDVAGAVARFAADPHVAWAQPDFRVDLDAVPDDPYFHSSGSWGQSYADLWGLHAIRAAEAWDVSLGEGVVVAVIDGGIDWEHPDLADNVWVNPGEDLDGNGRVDGTDRNGLDDDGNGMVDDFHGFDFANSLDANGDGDFLDPGDVNDADPFDDQGHGTHVAGTVAAVGFNGVGILGVAPSARIMGLKGFPAEGATTIEVLARAMVYAIENGARVINNSWSCSGRCPSNPVAEEVVGLAATRGVVVVTSAGNSRDDVVFFSPEKLRETIVVGASLPDDSLAGFSSRGLLVDVVAPGAGLTESGIQLSSRGILSLLSSGAGPAADGFGAFVVGDDYLRWSGTSMSTPHVAGLVALILSREPELDGEGVRARLRATARDLGAPGHDALFGAGIIDAAQALTASVPDLSAGFASPAQGAWVGGGDAPVELRGHVTGADLESWSLWLGEGTAPATWELLAEGAAPVEGGRLHEWDVSGRSSGGYAFRLEARTRDGARIEEFLLVSLERAVPTAISAGGFDASEPAVSGDRVVWRAANPAGIDAEQDLFLADLASGRRSLLIGAREDQWSPRIDGDRLVWLDARNDRREVFGCVLPRDRDGCEARGLGVGPGLRDAPTLSRGRVVWTERVDGRIGLMLCVPGSDGDCAPQRIELEGSQSEPLLDGPELSFTAPGTGQLFSCVLEADGRCESQPVDGPLVVVRPAVDAGVYAWQEPLGLDSRVAACVLDRETRECPSRVLGPAALLSGRPAVSGRRVVWEGGLDGGDLYLCELDPRRERCPLQKLTGSLAKETAPDIDGDRVVWSDNRSGVFEIYGLELPHLEPPPDREIRLGQRIQLPVRGRDANGEPLALEAELASGDPLGSVGLEFRDLGHGKGLISGRPDRVGRFDVTYTGTARNGIATRHTQRIEVRPRPGAPRP